MNYLSILARLYGNFSFKLRDEGGAKAVVADQIMSSTLVPGKGIWMKAIPRV